MEKEENEAHRGTPVPPIIGRQGMDATSYRRGQQLFARMAGRQAAAIRRRWRRLAPDFERYVLGFLAGEIWTRPQLDLRTRSLITIAALAATGRQQGLELNFLMARNNGVKREEIVEALLHLAPYIGFPAAWEALTHAARVFARVKTRRRGRR